MRKRAAIGIVVLAELLSCRQIAGITDNPPTDIAPATDACGLPWGTSTCAACVNAACCSEASSCAGDPQCAPYFQCRAGSADPERRAQCEKESPPQVGRWGPLFTCWTSRCEAECGLTCGDIASVVAVAPDAAVGCQACVNASACASERACARSVDCLESATCGSGCATPDCSAARCGDHEAGAALGGAFLSATSGCATACPGNDWDCVGHVAWPGATSQATTLTITVLDFVSQQPAAKLDVSVCQGTDPACANPLAQSRTDGSGYAELQVPAGVHPYGGVGANGYLELTSATTVPQLFYWGYPVSESRAPLALPYDFVLTPMALQQVEIGERVTQDPQRGIVGFFVVNCGGGAASGVQVTIDGTDGQVMGPFYGTSYNLSATATDATALAAFYNVPPGTVTVTATPLALGKPSAHASILVRAGYETVMMLHPTP